MGLLTLEVSVSVILLPVLGTLLLWGCPASIWELLPCLLLSYFVMIACCLLEAFSFLKGNGGGSGLKEEENKE